MKRQDFGCAPGCSVEVTLDLIDGKWKGVILYHLQEGRLRFGELRKKLPRITQRMLTKQLRALEEDDLIIRKVYAEVPPRVDYELSETGQRLRPVIDALKAWGDANRARVDAALENKAAGTKKARPQPDATLRPSKRPKAA
jgi:DNA-binding HxlR family transcriptional regulator